MATLDPFSAQFAALVRQLPDELLLDLVRAHLGAPAPPPPAFGAGEPKSPAPRPAVRRHVPRRRRAALLARVEEYVNRSDGVSLTEVTAASGASKERVRNALEDLKAAGRIAMGGKRKFARYAADHKTAEAASWRARIRK